jgi:hypothetical protein
MPLILRSTKGSPLTFNELDGNFTYLSESISEGGGTPPTASYALTASYVQNALTASYFSGSASIIGSLTTTAAGVIITGSLIISGSNTLNNVGPLTTGDINNIAYSNSMAQGKGTSATGNYSHAEGLGTIASANYQHVTGKYNRTSSNDSDLFIIGNGSSNASRSNILVVTTSSVNVRNSLEVSGSIFLKTPGQLNQFIQGPNHFVGSSIGVFGIHIQGRNNQIGAAGEYSHVEGVSNIIDGYACHAEGENVYIGPGTLGAHAEGFQTKIYGNIFHDKYAHYSHVEGIETIASGSYSHAEGAATIAIGIASHAEGLETIAKGNYQHVAGQYNATSSIDSAFIVGNGIDNDSRSNLIFAAGGLVSINNLLKLELSSTTPLLLEGMIMASGSAGSSKLYYCNGTSWVDLTA